MSEVFRAWDKNKNQYINSFVVNMNGSVYYDTEYSEGKADAILERATGIQDKNGRMIFEGDIVDGVLYADYSQHIGRVLYDHGGYMIVTKEKSMPLDLTEKLEIIGNINENKELLGEGG